MSTFPLWQQITRKYERRVSDVNANRLFQAVEVVRSHENRRKGFNHQILLIDRGFLYLYAECKDAKACNVQVPVEVRLQIFELDFFPKTFDNFRHGIFTLLEAISFVIIVICVRVIYRATIISADDLKCKRRKRAMSISRDFPLCGSFCLRKLELQKHQVTTIATFKASPEDEDSVHRLKTMSTPCYNKTQVEIINILLNILTTSKYKLGSIHFIVV